MLTGELQALEHALAEQYRFVREAGRGGSGVVFVADDLKSGTQVAIKILRLELAGPRARQRFLREIDYSSRHAGGHAASHPTRVRSSKASLSATLEPKR